MTNQDAKLIAIMCERSVDFTDRVDEKGYLKDQPGIKVIPVPCSGMIQPIMIETALKNGADGVIAGGCRMGDCYYREGNKFCRERLVGERMPKLKPNVDKRRVQGYWLSALEYDQFHEMASEFYGDLCKLKSEGGTTATAGGSKPGKV